MSVSVSTADSLPYTDTKPVGAADFYCAINATFRFVLRRFGMDGLKNYWTQLGRGYHHLVSLRWREGGLPAVAGHWRAFFQAEPGAVVTVEELEDEVKVSVQVCPAIRHLREHRREIVPVFCHHCYFVSEAMAAPAGMTVRICGGNGSCTQRFIKVSARPGPQSLEDIATAS